MVVTLPVSEPLDLLAPEARTVGCTPDCALPNTEVSQGRWGIGALVLEVTARDGRTPARFAGERHFRMDLSPATSDTPVAVLAGAVALPSDRSHPPRARLDLNLVLTAVLFDTVDWSALTAGPDGVVDFGDPANAGARTALLERLARFSPQAEVSRGDP
jgi:hypothetical protein